ncbi:uncharacterized protein BJX67DRAFT_144615 [Aspergillus lucknowensis]|uniref:Uncharacterized protein n=1 Tax=Aspergillus lucknowensis TaxID=176173 RepID=A0ABR4LP33_9EURO
MRRTKVSAEFIRKDPGSVCVSCIGLKHYCQDELIRWSLVKSKSESFEPQLGMSSSEKLTRMLARIQNLSLIFPDSYTGSWGKEEVWEDNSAPGEEMKSKKRRILPRVRCQGSVLKKKREGVLLQEPLPPLRDSGASQDAELPTGGGETSHRPFTPQLLAL